MDFLEFEKKAGINFKNKELLKQAFTHRSYLNEVRNFKIQHNERLEFLGDAVLELAVTEYLFNRFPEKTEGELTSYRAALVNALTCARVAIELGVNNFLLLSKGEAKDVGRARQYILANTLEAIIGAIYLDQGYEFAKKFILEHVTPLTDEILQTKSWIDAKSRFQERAQEITGTTPSYKVIKEVGPDHDKHFTSAVFLGEEKIAEGQGVSKQEAEQEAAASALEEKGW
ncbi:MAG: ribonuclease III [Candidatus Paceibacterota bacterium]|nr:MAG: ribonuclease III [Candidatus Paceibacterota bacterium]